MRLVSDFFNLLGFHTSFALHSTVSLIFAIAGKEVVVQFD